MFLGKDNYIKWKLLGIVTVIVAALCFVGVLWFDIPVYALLRQFDWSIWRILDAVFATKVWLSAGGLGALWLGFLVVRDNVCSGPKNKAKSPELSKGSKSSFAKQFKVFQKSGHLAVKAKNCFYKFKKRLSGADGTIFATLFYVFLSVASVSVVASVLKILIGRMRPVFWEAFGQTGFYPGVSEWAFNSMPSGHASSSFAGLVMIGLIFPRIKWVTWTMAVAIGVSRVCVGAHFPADVIMGAFLGMVAADLVRNVVKGK